jgi:hypothetical protein
MIWGRDRTWVPARSFGKLPGLGQRVRDKGKNSKDWNDEHTVSGAGMFAHPLPERLVQFPSRRAIHGMPNQRHGPREHR